jgi:uncharacterized membrane protein YhaH (DUF805 family)
MGTAPKGQGEEMSFCIKCGNETAENSKFCAKCGTPVAAMQTPTTETTAAPVAAPTVTPTAAPAVTPAVALTTVPAEETVEELSHWGYYIKCFKNYANFSGRARRKEFWGFTLFHLLFIIGTAFLGPVLFLYALATFIPNWAVTFRRAHDIGKSGVLYVILLIVVYIGSAIEIVLFFMIFTDSIATSGFVVYFLSAVITFICAIYLLISLCKDGDYLTNEYGVSPKYGTSLESKTNTASTKNIFD